MLNTSLFGKELKKLGFDFFTGVPCSYLKHLIHYALNECEYLAAANEGDAIAIASGAYLGGKKTVVLMQNSGLTNSISPLVSLNYPFQIPLVGFVSLRGEPGIPDEPQHELMGQITTQMLEMMHIQWQYLSKDFEEAKGQLKQAVECVNQNQSFFFVVKKGTFEPEVLRQQDDKDKPERIKRNQQREAHKPTRHEALLTINAVKDSATIQIATTGKTGRELYEIEDSYQNLYMVGSMGCISSLGLGLALSRPEHKIIVIDGDGSLLMRMGSMATNGYYKPPNMLHILLDNHAHDSTGGQRTVSHNVDFVELAFSCGYTKTIYIHDLVELENELKEWQRTRGLTFLYVKIMNGSTFGVGRPNIKPHEVKERLKRFIDSDAVQRTEVGGTHETYS